MWIVAGGFLDIVFESLDQKIQGFVIQIALLR
jgi:hypothetical protein